MEKDRHKPMHRLQQAAAGLLVCGAVAAMAVLLSGGFSQAQPGSGDGIRGRGGFGGDAAIGGDGNAQANDDSSSEEDADDSGDEADGSSESEESGGTGASGGEGIVQLHAGSQAPYVHKISLAGPDGSTIDPSSSMVPYSPAETCGSCHNVDAATHGWHHNAASPMFKKDGRPGEPYFWVSSASDTQLPVSPRDWPGAYDLPTLGLSPWDFTIRFGGFTPGGGLGSTFNDQGAKDPEARWNLTGKLEVDCLSCHLAGDNYNFVAWRNAVKNHNFKWAPTAAVPWASVEGAMTEVPQDYNPMMSGFGADNPVPKARYHESRFDGSKVRLAITNDIPNQRCFTCHSKRPTGPNAMPRWHRQQDVHMAQGMSCVDCHANAMDHMTSRNHPDDPVLDKKAVQTLTCKGCHMGTEDSELGTLPAGRRMAAPTPEHEGIPPLHFAEMSCTSCHSGPNPTRSGHTVRIQTSMAHELGISSEHRDHRTLPHMVSPVFLENNAGKIAPHRAVWPAFWGLQQPNAAEAATQPTGASGAATQPPPGVKPITPLPVEKVTQTLEDVLPAPGHPENWQTLSPQQIAEGLGALRDEGGWGQGTLVYVSGGKVYRPAQTSGNDADPAQGEAANGSASEADAESAGLKIIEDHPAANAYTWPLAHDVRPAAQSLGAESCKQCHSAKGATDFTMTAAPTWAQVQAEVPTLPRQTMHQMRSQPGWFLSLWNQLFGGRTLFKWLAGISTLIGLVILLAYGGSGLRKALDRSGAR
jgi:nitrate/TMAO reductase-like tetraheme cytochrome c subunit